MKSVGNQMQVDTMMIMISHLMLNGYVKNITENCIMVTVMARGKSKKRTEMLTLRKLRRSIPKTEGCIRCGECCGPLRATPYEIIKIVSMITRKELWPEVRENLNVNLESDNEYVQVSCPLLRMNEDVGSECMVYNQRPIVCRLHGLKRTLPCKNIDNSIWKTTEEERAYYLNLKEKNYILAVVVAKALDNWQRLGNVSAAELMARED